MNSKDNEKHEKVEQKLEFGRREKSKRNSSITNKQDIDKLRRNKWRS